MRRQDTERTQDVADLYLPLWSPATRFVPAKECIHCSSDVTFLVAPTHFPIETVLKVCYACGRVREAVDGLLIMSVREAIVEFQAKPFAVRRGIALQPSNAEVARELILLGLEGGLRPREVAAELDVDIHYVEKIARAAEIYY